MLRTDTAGLGHILYDSVDLVLGDGYRRIAFGQPAGKVSDRGENRRCRPEDSVQEHKRPDAAERKFLTILFGNALGKHLSEKEYKKGCHERADCYRADSPDAGHLHSNDRRGPEMGYVRAYKNCTYRSVKMFQRVEDQSRALVAAIRQGLHPNFGDRR